MPSYDIALFTHRGAVRAVNQDAVYAGGQIFQGNLRDVVTLRLKGVPQTVLVADGIGGQPHGDLASRVALQFLTSQVNSLDGPADCEAALHAANDRLYELMDDPGHIGMGTTVVGFVLQENRLIAFNVGDSQAYRYGSGGFIKIGYNDVVASGTGRASSRGSHQLSQALGGSIIPLSIIPHVSVEPPIRAGERFLLSSDGLTDTVSDDDIANALRVSASPATIVQQLVRRAIYAGARDNISVLIGIRR